MRRRGITAKRSENESVMRESPRSPWGRRGLRDIQKGSPKAASVDADFYHDALKLNANVIENMRKDLEYFKSSLLDKDSTIQENNEQVITMRTQLVKLQTELDHIKSTLAAVRKNYDRQVDDLAQRDATIKLLQAQLAHYSSGTTFPQGVADDRSPITPDK
jgi:uncharacterized coiled-coil DUF342 family protein